MAIGTLFTIFITPAIYTFLARDHAREVADCAALASVNEAKAAE
jgi:hypothetical protein